MVDIDPLTGAPIVAPKTEGNQSNNPTSDFTPPTTEPAKPLITEMKPPTGKSLTDVAKEAKESVKAESVAKAIESAKGKSDKELLHDEIANIQKEYGGMESNIPLNHPYWDMCNKFRGMK